MAHEEMRLMQDLQASLRIAAEALSEQTRRVSRLELALRQSELALGKAEKELARLRADRLPRGSLPGAAAEPRGLEPGVRF